MSFYSKFYSGKYKKYFIAPAIVLILSLVFIFSFGIKQGIDLSGGTLLTIHTKQTIDVDALKNYLITEYSLEDVSVSLSKGVESNRLDIQYIQEKNLESLRLQIQEIKNLESQNQIIEQTKIMLTNHNVDINKLTINEQKEWVAQLDLLYNNEKNKRVNEVLVGLNSKFGLDTTNVDIKEISPTLSATFYSKVVLVAIIAIVLITLIIFLVYREFVPSVAIIACGLLDVLAGLAGMALFNIPLSLVSIPALLMLLGYSIDTDIMLTTRLLKRKEGSNVERAGESMRTGVIMTTTAIASVIVMLIFASLYNITVFFDISIILLFGLVADLIATWMMNGPILLWYVESKK
jgi:preprotein translocase subunit SecF